MKKLFSVLLAVAILLPSLAGIVPVLADDNKVIDALSPAIPADAGQTVDLKGYTVELDNRKSISDPTWEYNGETVTSVKFDQKGVYPLTASDGTDSRTVYVVVKNTDETEYVLYENQFDSAADIEGLTISGNASFRVEDGKLVANAMDKGNSILLLPQWLGDFGNYRIRTSAAMIQSTDANRWFSLCYRYNDGNYMHMCVRKAMTKAGGRGTSGGIECVDYNGNYRYLLSDSYKKDMEYGKFYDFAVSAYGDTLQYTVENKAVIHIPDMTYYYAGLPTSGQIGLQCGYGTEMHFDSIKVTLNLSAPEKPVDNSNTIIAVPNNNSNLLNAVTDVATVAYSKLDTLLAGSVLPNSVLVKFEKGFTDQDLTKLYEKCSAKNVIPGLYITTAEEAQALAAWCSENETYDIHTASANAEALKQLREQESLLRTFLVVEDVAGLTAQQLREKIRACAANVLMLPADQSEKSVVDALQQLHVTVWSYGEELTTQQIAFMVTSGANGIVTDDPAQYRKVVTEVFGPDTLTKTPSVIGHRGNPSQAPENSIAGYLTAVANGATEVETDIYFTKDKQIIIMHDNTLNRTTNYTGSKTIPEMTLEEIRQYRLKNLDGTVSDDPVPTLEEMFIALEDTNVFFVIELKSGDEQMLEPLYALIDKYDVADRVNFISFSGQVLAATHALRPAFSAGLLTSGSISATTSNMEKMRQEALKMIRTAQTYNCTVNPHHGSMTKELYQMLNDRGISLWPWTFNNGSVGLYCNAFLWGVDGLTTDNCQTTKNAVMDFVVDTTGKQTVGVGKQLTLEPTTVTYGGEILSALDSLDIVWLENEIGAQFDITSGVLTAGEQTGTVSFMLNYRASLLNGKEYVLYSQPITVQVSGSAPDSPGQQPDDNTAANSDGLVLILAIGAVALVAIIGAVIVIVDTKKHKK